MTVVDHDLRLTDRAAMLAKRAALALAAKPVLAPESRPGFDKTTAKTPAPDSVVFETGAAA